MIVTVAERMSQVAFNEQTLVFLVFRSRLPRGGRVPPTGVTPEASLWVLPRRYHDLERKREM